MFITSPPNYIEREAKNKIRFRAQSYFLEAIGDRCKVVKGMTEENMKNFATVRENYAKDKVHMSTRGARAFFEQIIDSLPTNE